MAQGPELYHPGLEGIIAGETAISAVEQDSLAYRGYSIGELAEHARFEEVAYLLLHEDLPNQKQLADFTKYVDSQRALPPAVVDCIRAMPADSPGMDVLRTAVSLRGQFPTPEDPGLGPLRSQAAAVVAVIPTIIATRMRLLAGKPPVQPRPGLSHAAQFYWLAFEKTPTALEEKVLDLTFILYAEHEFNASTFAARVCASTLSDLWSAMVTGIGTLKGPLHGGANEEVVTMLSPLATAEAARAWALDRIAKKQLIMGFGHRVYKNGDHRARILDAYVERLGAERGQADRVAVWREVKKIVMEKKGLHPNLDYPCGMVYQFMALPTDIYTPLFVASRVTGWSAHFIEQHEHNRIIRPRSRYTGPTNRSYVPLAQR